MRTNDTQVVRARLLRRRSCRRVGVLQVRAVLCCVVLCGALRAAAARAACVPSAAYTDLITPTMVGFEAADALAVDVCSCVLATSTGLTNEMPGSVHVFPQGATQAAAAPHNKHGQHRTIEPSHRPRIIGRVCQCQMPNTKYQIPKRGSSLEPNKPPALSLSPPSPPPPPRTTLSLWQVASTEA